jgi:hypothetical protein
VTKLVMLPCKEPGGTEDASHGAPIQMTSPPPSAEDARRKPSPIADASAMGREQHKGQDPRRYPIPFTPPGHSVDDEGTRLEKQASDAKRRSRGRSPAHGMLRSMARGIASAGRRRCRCCRRGLLVTTAKAVDRHHHNPQLRGPPSSTATRECHPLGIEQSESKESRRRYRRSVGADDDSPVNH